MRVWTFAWSPPPIATWTISSPPGSSVRTSCTGCASSTSTCLPPRAARRRSRADEALPGALRAGAELYGRCASRVAAIQMAGQRPRADERVEQLVWLSAGAVVGVQHLPLSMRSGPGLIMTVDDGRQVADELYETLARQGGSFWEHVYPRFLAHDITRDDLRELVRRGLRESQGHYKALFTLFGISSGDYGRFYDLSCSARVWHRLDEFRGALRAADAEAGTRPLSVADPKPRLHWTGPGHQQDSALGIRDSSHDDRSSLAGWRADSRLI